MRCIVVSLRQTSAPKGRIVFIPGCKLVRIVQHLALAVVLVLVLVLVLLQFPSLALCGIWRDGVPEMVL